MRFNAYNAIEGFLDTSNMMTYKLSLQWDWMEHKEYKKNILKWAWFPGGPGKALGLLDDYNKMCQYATHG